jgi:acetyltransferase-like isoleucine patch superfamily enzyme
MNIRKMINYKPSLSDIISYVYVKMHTRILGFLGTLIFRIKAAFFGVEIQGRVECYGTVHIMRAPKSVISIGNNVSIVSSSQRCTAGSLYAPTKLRTWSRNAKIIIEDNVGLNGTSIAARSKTIKIGRGTMIAPNVVIMDSNYHALWPPENRATRPAFESDAHIIIGSNVWIGSSCIILKGIDIGDNSIIAAGSVVTSNIPANVLAGGVPAKVIRKLP